MSYSRVHNFQTFVFVFASEHENDYTLRSTHYQLVHKSRRNAIGLDDRFATKSTKHPQQNHDLHRRIWYKVTPLRTPWYILSWNGHGSRPSSNSTFPTQSTRLNYRDLLRITIGTQLESRVKSPI